MKFINLFILVCLIFCGHICSSFAQNTAIDSTSQQPAFNKAVSMLNTSTNKESRLYNGPEYYLYDPSIKGTAYFQGVSSFTKGSIYYDGAKFDDVPMLYDIYKDEVAVFFYNHILRFSLVKSKLGWFNLLGHHFININADTLVSNQVLKSGIYDQLYNGKSQIIAKLSKDIQVTPSSTLGSESYFDTKKTAYFIKFKGKFYAFSSQNSLIEILKDRKKQLQQFIKSGNLKYRANPEDVMVKIAAYYDQIN